jgi:hypothetical protein
MRKVFITDIYGATHVVDPMLVSYSAPYSIPERHPEEHNGFVVVHFMRSGSNGGVKNVKKTFISLTEYLRLMNRF